MSQNSKTAKMVLGRYYSVLNSRLALARLAFLNTWNKNTKTEVVSRNNVVHQSVLTPRILQWMLMPMVERHVQACLNFSLSFCLRVRVVAWRHSDYDVSIASSSLCIACDVTSCNAGSVPVTENYSYTIYRPLLLKKDWIIIILTLKFTVR